MYYRGLRILKACGLLCSRTFVLLTGTGPDRRTDLLDDEFRRVARTIDREYRRVRFVLTSPLLAVLTFFS